MVATVVQSLPRTGRKNRRPQHSFQVRQVPYAIQPVLLAPVIPGESLENLLLQARVVTDPIKNPLVGWWIEYYFFYCKHRDLNIRDELTKMVLDPSWTAASILEVNPDPKYYFAGNGINWAKHCLERVVEMYFRDEGEAWDAFMIDGLPAASINSQTWMDSLMPAAAMRSVDVEVPVTNGEVSIEDIDDAMRQYEVLRQANLVTATYEEWLASYGVRPASVELHKPELVRFIRDWSYPTNTVDPVTGTPTSAVSWSIAERADKVRFFKEPGFILGISVCRPKVYLSKQTGSASWLMRDAFTWLPAVLADDSNAGMTLVPPGVGPVPSASDAGGYYADVKDLLVYGEQFANFDLAAADAASAALPLPQPTLQRRYVSALADIQALFKNGATAYTVRQDGVVQLTIASRQQDTTPRTAFVR